MCAYHLPLMDRLLGLAATIGANPSDSEEMRLRKALLVLLALLISLLAVGWGLIYIIFGEPLGGAIPLSYTVLSLASVVLFTLTRRYDWFRFAQLGLMLVLPFVLMVVLGGFVLSSVVAAWAFVAPLGALAFASPREALRWFGAYLILVVLTGTLGGAVRTANNLPTGLVDAMFILNIVGVSVIVFIALYVFVRERDRAFAVVQRLFGQYLSPQIARALISDPRKAQLGGDIRDVTALFADLEGFTPFTESRPPRETVAALNRYFTAVVPVIFANGGTIIQFAGDAIVAVWNAPVEQPRHALTAARAALAMQVAIEGIVREDATLPRFRVGIATGAALVGNVGSEEFHNYVAHGDAVNLAARLQTGAKAGQVVISGPTYALIRDAAAVRPLGRFTVKGKVEEVEAFLLEGLRV
ncbi:MAG: adenylate/guanylate cyclase domain-containing protein [Chloroflexi bacterium]|nr:MAG: adenylate/guanylate cyclase domain-containing protein [Chloroflexota bacterium]